MGNEFAKFGNSLMETALQFRKSALLLGAIKLDLFERIGPEFRCVDQLPGEEDPDGLRRLCRALAGMDLLEKENDRFRNPEHVEELLTSRGKHDIRPILEEFIELYEMWGELDSAVLKGQMYEFDREKDELFDETFTEAMEARARFSAEELAEVLEDRIEWSHLLDLGGGSGVFARALVKNNPETTGVVADQPEPLHVARRYIDSSSLAERLDTQTVDLLEDEQYGEDFDLVLLSAILHLFGPAEARTVLERSHSALSEGGFIVVRDYIVHDDHSGPLDSLLFDVLMYLATERGQTYTEQQLRQMLANAGFDEIDRIELSRSTDDLLIGKKK